MTPIAIWPATLPQLFRRPSYREALWAPVHEFPTDAGEPITAPMTTVRMIEIEGAMIMRLGQYSQFEDFVWFQLDQGRLPFWFPRPRDGAQRRVVIASNGGRPYATKPISAVEWEVFFKLLMSGL